MLIRHASLILTLLISIIFGLAAAGSCYLAAHVSLGLFLGPLLFATILTPPLALSRENITGQGAAVLGIVLGMSAVWAVATMRSDITLLQWLQCTLVLGTLLIALWGLASLISRATRNAVYASAITVILGLLWMTWPVWLSSGLAGASNEGRAVAWLVPMHPPLLLSTLLDMGVWGEQRVAYHLTTLGQDIVYRPPTHLWMAIVMHCAIGVAALAASWLMQRRVPRRREDAKNPDQKALATS